MNEDTRETSYEPHTPAETVIDFNVYNRHHRFVDELKLTRVAYKTLDGLGLRMTPILYGDGEIARWLDAADQEQQTHTDDSPAELLATLVDEAHANRRTGWDENRGDAYARHWGGVAGWLRSKLPAGHPLAFRRPATAEDAEA